MAEWREKCVRVKFCFKSGQNAAQPFEMLEVPLEKRREERKFLSGFPSVTGFDKCWRCEMHGISINMQDMKMWIKELFLETEEFCYPWSCWRVRNFIYVSVEHTERHSEHVSVCHHIHAAPAEWEVEGDFMATCARQFHTLPTETLLSFLRTKDGFRGKETHWYHHV
jgi:hypothetical protein